MSLGGLRWLCCPRDLMLCEGHRCLQAGGTCSNFLCCQGEAAPVSQSSLTESFGNTKSFWCMGVIERLSSFRMQRATERDLLGHVKGQTSACTWSIWRKHLLFCKPREIANVWLREPMKEGCLLSTSACLSFGYLLNTFFVCWKDFLLVQEELSILFLLVTRIYVSEYVPSLLFSGK